MQFGSGITIGAGIAIGKAPQPMIPSVVDYLVAGGYRVYKFTSFGSITF
jgi:hypothetical protein